MKTIYVISAFYGGYRDHHNYTFAALDNPVTAREWADQHSDDRAGKVAVLVEAVAVGALMPAKGWPVAYYIPSWREETVLGDTLLDELMTEKEE